MSRGFDQADKISPEERAERVSAINFARGSVRYEGLVVTPRAEALYQRFIDGELTLDELGLAIKAAVAIPASLT